MPQQENCDREKSAPSWNYFWMISSSNWSQIFQKEFLKANQKPLEKEEASFVSKTMIVGVCLTFILLITIVGIQSANISQAIQGLDTKSVKQLMFLRN
ncbi:hypothetical protein HC931_26005 [Candidatus Gracilibacteria bacterium]|nr:hypothetical protein [Candidatus Gracilibacteria bacterium]